MSRTQRSPSDCSPAWHPNRVFVGVTVALSALSAGVLYLGSQLATPHGLRQLTPEDAANLYHITVTAEPAPPEEVGDFLRTQRPRNQPAGKIGGSRAPALRSPRLRIQKAVPAAVREAAQVSGVLGLMSGSHKNLASVFGADGALSREAADAMAGLAGTSLDGAVSEAMRTLPSADAGPDTSRYQGRSDNGITQVAEAPVSTFSMDVDTGSYSNVRGYIEHGTLPPYDAVRVEELVNYFPYDYAEPSGPQPFSVSTETARSPWNPDHLLLRIGVQAKRESKQALPPANLVFLVDVSGSMYSPDKLPLLQATLRNLVAELRPQDRVSLVTYAGAERIALEPTPGNQRERILTAIDDLSAGGSTAGEAGIRTAYALARRSFVRGGINRVLLATDGDFNVGVSDVGQLKSLVAEGRRSGVSLSTLGFGRGNYNDELMEQIADVGNGNYSYIDSLNEGQKVLSHQLGATLHTVAKDVKVQVEFQPSQVSEYRLLGYENRMLAREDFKNDAVDAGEVGSGASVTAIYELTPAGSPRSVEPLRYGSPPTPTGTAATPHGAELAFVRVRYQPATGGESRQLQLPVPAASAARPFAQASDDFRFAVAVAGFGQILRGGRHTRSFDLRQIVAIAGSARGQDPEGYRRDFITLARRTDALMRN